MADAEANVQPAQAEAAAQAEASAQGAQGAEAAAPAGQAQGGGAQGAVVAEVRFDDPDVIQALTSDDGKVRVTRETLQTGLTADQAQLLWDWAMHQHARCEKSKQIMKRFIRDMETAIAKGGRNGPDEADDDDEPLPQGQVAHAPILHAMDIKGEYVPYGLERWQRKRVAHKGILKALRSKFAVEIVEDVCDSRGRLYVIGDESNATHCGAFPHALVKHKVGPHKGKEVYVCSRRLDVVVTVRLVNKQLPADDPKRYDVTEKDVINELSRMNDDERLAGWGTYENSLTFYVELQFYAPGSGERRRYVCTDQRDEELSAFKKPPSNGKLLVPSDVRPYAQGPQEVAMINGRAEMQFSFNENVINKNLTRTYHNDLFCLKGYCLNPYLNGYDDFTATSSPFMIKASLHNDLAKMDRWVYDDTGTKVTVEKSLVTRMAPSRRLAFAKKPAEEAEEAADESTEDE